MPRRSTVVVLIVIAVTAILIAACSSSDPYEPQAQSERPRGMGGMGQGGGGFRGAMDPGEVAMLEILPPANWWHDDRIANAVKLTPDQVASLDKIYSDQHDDIARLQRDTQVAARQLRDSLGLDTTKADDITSAGVRVKTLRDDIFDRQLKMLADERLVLSTQQWASLENALQNARTERQQERRGGYPGGRGRGGFGGRRPGFGF